MKHSKDKTLERFPSKSQNHDHAESPPESIREHGLKGILKRTKASMDEDNIMIIAAGVAFYLLIGIVPGLIALISIYGLVADPQQVQQQFNAVSGILPAEATTLLSEQIQRIAGNKTTAGWGAAISIFAALWASSSAMKALVKALNIAYGETETRKFFKLTAVTLFLTIGAVITGILAVGAIVFLPMILEAIGMGSQAQLIANIARWPLLAIVAIIGLSALYRLGPDRKGQKSRWISWGAVAAMLIFVLGSAGFSFYVSNFGKYNETYGSLAAIVVMMLWLYLSSVAVLVGAELNSEMEHQSVQDTAKERNRVAGRKRGAAADHLGESYA